MRTRLPLLAAVASLALLAAPAHADDASFKRAWDADDAQFSKLGKEYRAALRRWRGSGFRRARGALRSNSRARALLESNTRRLAGETTSSENGRQGRRYALKSNNAFGNQLRYEARGIKLTTRGRRAAGTRAFARAEQAARRSTRAAKKAKTFFRRAGVG